MGFEMFGLLVPVILVGIAAAFLFTVSAAKRPCPHCRTMMPKKAVLCPHCRKTIPLGY